MRLTPKTCPSPRVSMLNVVVPSGLCMPMINGDFSLSQIARAYVGRSAKHSNRLSRSLKVIGTYTDRSATYDFLLVIRSNHGPILCRFRDKSWLRSKISNSYTYSVTPRLTGTLVFFVTAVGLKKTIAMPLRESPEVSKTWHNAWRTDRQTDRNDAR